MIQGIYTMVTAVWPILHIKSFMEVTGYKEDVWLVKTVAAVLIAIAACFLDAARAPHFNRPVAVLAITSAVALAIVDFYYSVTDVISNIYQLDGLLQIAFLVSWIAILVIKRRGERIKSPEA
jgi:hypothetical protein